MRHSRASLMTRLAEAEVAANKLSNEAFCSDLIDEVLTLPVAIRDATGRHLAKMNASAMPIDFPRPKSQDDSHALFLRWTAEIAPEVAETVGLRWNLEWKLPQGEESVKASPEITGPVAGGVAVATSAKTNAQD